jgi:hypothetical protein
MSGKRFSQVAGGLFLSLVCLTACHFSDALSAVLREPATRCTATLTADIAPIYNTPYGYYPVSAEIVEQATSGIQFVVTGREEQGWYQLDSPERWLWLGDGWELTGACDSLPALDEGEFINPLPNPNLCYYSQYGDGSPYNAYTDPRLGVPEAILELENRVYEAVSRTERWYEIALDDGQTGWVRSGTGSLVSTCEELPFERLRPDPPEDECSLYMDAIYEFDTTLYHQPDVENGTVVGTAPEDTYIVVEARRSNGEGYRVRLDDGVTGWLMTPWRGLALTAAFSGPCNDVPYEDTQPGG